MIDAILFDLDETLLNRRKSLESFIESQYKILIEPKFNIDFQKYKNRFIELDDNGYTWKDEVYESLIKEFRLINLSKMLLLEDYILNFHKSVVPMDHLIETLDEISSKGIKLGIITNGRTDFQKNNIKALGIEKYFRSILVSEEIGIKKPDANIFYTALNQLNVSPSNSLFVGDHLHNDVIGSMKVGMKGILFDQYQKHLDFENRISTLLEIKNFINEY
ncbi:HAD family hydrolase [Macrococcus sp. DPC7161]|uniref:HAD family hydrolase n=1 Tax=Macrococcus sp. DPC7161 TaxID=2507060 RepID=UPI00100B1FD4|nr:HAD family hydrolase [Macrococcus sp. DPC7161]RXK17515.1 HAD family hydrolase [Macrococcus sp. DPC7161]